MSGPRSSRCARRCSARSWRRCWRTCETRCARRRSPPRTAVTCWAPSLLHPRPHHHIAPARELARTSRWVVGSCKQLNQSRHALLAWQLALQALRTVAEAESCPAKTTALAAHRRQCVGMRYEVLWGADTPGRMHVAGVAWRGPVARASGPSAGCHTSTFTAPAARRAALGARRGLPRGAGLAAAAGRERRAVGRRAAAGRAGYLARRGRCRAPRRAAAGLRVRCPQRRGCRGAHQVPGSRQALLLRTSRSCRANSCEALPVSCIGRGYTCCACEHRTAAAQFLAYVHPGLQRTLFRSV